MIQLKEISKTFYSKKNEEVTALKGVSLEVKQGEIFGVIGYSGAGKSTLVRCVNLLEKPTSGDVVVNGASLKNMSKNELRKSRQNIGMIFQGFNLLKTATVYENIAIPLKLTGISSKEIPTRVEKYLAIVGLEDKHHVYPGQLSGGQKQRVAIARALSHEPDVLLSDEATSALDPETTHSILDLLLKINREFGITILLITHEMHVIQKICDRVAVMENGEVIEQGNVIDLYSSPKKRTTKKFVNSLFPNDLPKEILEQLKKRGPIISMTFVGTSADKPALSQLSKKFDVDANILSGNIVQLKDKPFGKLVAHIQGETEETDKALHYLKEEGVQVDEVEINES
ncbi:methionine ABC transporter ATP-binding protein [Salipaludibacillus keqinensis]|uniref:Methionine ABC transporter ATP-binding protein n=1 Tax=Salipaludibacillus keqinensis TaxID=2045207 RepID=A0A323T9H5_9BACI|nr:methionine ABC transporter ATP-binding protein [Salipaludibacillus keqinensis]PYZ91756.1 methionine ABC transporter ATP-binding protein [Salipaludibacillus keqinensis]